MTEGSLFGYPAKVAGLSDVCAISQAILSGDQGDVAA